MDQRKGGTVEEESGLRLKTLFDALDSDGDGRIGVDILKSYYQDIADSNPYLEDMDKKCINYMVEAADLDGNQEITFSEFVSMMKRQNNIACHPKVHRWMKYATYAVVPKKERTQVVNRYMEVYSCFPPPVFMVIMSLLEIAVFIFYCVELGDFSPSGPVPYESVLIYHPRRRYEFWRFITYGLVHAGFIHILFNVLVQLMLGIPLEMVHGGARISFVYLSGFLAGSLGASITDPRTFLCGASGGVYALIAAHMANVMINYKEMEFGPIRLLGIGIFSAADIFVAVRDRYFRDTPRRVSYSAHLAGAAAGLLMGVVLLRNIRVRKWELKMWAISLSFYVILSIGAITFNVFGSSYFDPPDHEPLFSSFPRPVHDDW